MGSATCEALREGLEEEGRSGQIPSATRGHTFDVSLLAVISPCGGTEAILYSFSEATTPTVHCIANEYEKICCHNNRIDKFCFWGWEMSMTMMI